MPVNIFEMQATEHNTPPQFIFSELLKPALMSLIQSQAYKAKITRLKLLFPPRNKIFQG